MHTRFGRDLKEEGNIRRSLRLQFSFRARTTAIAKKRTSRFLSLSPSLPQYPFISVRTDITSAVTPRYIITEAVMEIARFVTTTAGTEDSLGDARTAINDHFQRLFAGDGCCRTRTKRGEARRKEEE